MHLPSFEKEGRHRGGGKESKKFGRVVIGSLLVLTGYLAVEQARASTY
jgi:hypothetical protein